MTAAPTIRQTSDKPSKRDRVVTPIFESLPSRVMLTAVTARPADSLVDSIGVNIHVSYTDTSYGRFSEWKTLLVDSGIRHVRDGLNDMGTTSYFYNRLKELASAGVRTTVIPGNGNTTSNMLTIADRLGPGVIEAFEGQNEIVNIYNANRDPAAARTYQQGWYNTVKASATYGDRPVYAPTFVGGNGPADELGDLTSYIDYGTLHSYAYIRPTTPSFNISELRYMHGVECVESAISSPRGLFALASS